MKPFYFQVNISNFDLVMESDLGTFRPVALQFTGNDAARTVGMTTQVPNVYHELRCPQHALV